MNNCGLLSERLIANSAALLIDFTNKPGSLKSDFERHIKPESLHIIRGTQVIDEVRMAKKTRQSRQLKFLLVFCCGLAWPSLALAQSDPFDKLDEDAEEAPAAAGASTAVGSNMIPSNLSGLIGSTSGTPQATQPNKPWGTFETLDAQKLNQAYQGSEEVWREQIRSAPSTKREAFGSRLEDISKDLQGPKKPVSGYQYKPVTPSGIYRKPATK